jgi:uncharacterized protein YjbJ (UPF0337 family)
MPVTNIGHLANTRAVDAKNKAAEVAGIKADQAKGQAQEAAGQAKGKAAELEGKAKGKTEEVKGKM